MVEVEDLEQPDTAVAGFQRSQCGNNSVNMDIEAGVRVKEEVEDFDVIFNEVDYEQSDEEAEVDNITTIRGQFYVFTFFITYFKAFTKLLII